MAGKKDKLKRIELEEHEILSKLKRIEKEERKIEKQEADIKKSLSWKHVHGTQLARAFVGSVLGIALSSFLFGAEIVNRIGMESAWIMFGFSIISAAYVSYKTEKGILSRNSKLTARHIFGDVILYIAVAFIVSYILLFAFGLLPAFGLELLEILLIYSLPAVAGALTLTLI